MNDYPVKKWIQKLKQGKMLQEIAEDCDRCQTTISKYILEEAEAESIYELKRNVPRWVEMVRDEKMSCKKVGEKYNYGSEVVRRRVLETVEEESIHELRKDRDEWERLHTEEEMPVAQIVQNEYGARKEIVEELKKRGVYENHHGREEVTQEEKEQWKRLHVKERIGTAEIKNRTGTEYSRTTIRRHLLEMGVYAPNPNHKANPPIEKIIEYGVEKDENSGCWIWKGRKYPGHNGYATALNHDENKFLHRQSYKIANGLDEIPEGKVVRHKCDIRTCVNPDHLELGTTQENVDDYHQLPKDLHALSQDALRDILNREEENWLQIAEDHNVRLATVRYILEEK